MKSPAVNILLALAACATALCMRCSSSADIAGTSTNTGNARASIVAARAVDSDGKGAAHAKIFLRPPNYLAHRYQDIAQEELYTKRDAVADDSGYFVLDSLDIGRYFIEISDPAGNALLIDMYVDGDTSLGDQVITPAATIEGTVKKDSLLGNVAATVYGLERWVPLDSSGSYSLADMPAGIFTVRLVPDNASFGAVEFDNVAVSSGQERTLDTVSIVSFDNEVYSKWSGSATLRLNTTTGGAGVAEDVYNFPLLVRLDSSNFAFSAAENNGHDIRFAKSDGSRLRYDIEYWDNNRQQAAVWVLMDTVYGNSSAQSITMHWGNAGAPDFSNSAVVFDTAQGFIGAWHFAPDAPMRDGTGNGNNGVNMKTQETDGIAGTGRYFDGSAGIRVNDRPSLEPASLYIAAWVRLATTHQRRYAHFITKDNLAPPHNSYSLELHCPTCETWTDNPIAKFQIAQPDSQHLFAVSQNQLSGKQWYHIAATFDESSGRGALYINGVLQGAFTNAVPIRYATDRDCHLYFGCQDSPSSGSLNGSLDEIRMMRAPVSDSRIKLSYENQKSGSMLIAFE